NSWQVAYVWAFIVKFNQLEKIRKLECLEDFEQCLSEPVANRPDDVLEGVLVRFLHNLKPGMRNLDCTNIQLHLSIYIHEMLLNSTEFTVWDRPWAPHEEARSGCCNPSEQRKELGRLRYVGEPLETRTYKNPLKQVEKRGGGLFELNWRERAKLLRQMVDWQLVHADNIRTIINRKYRIGETGRKKAEPHIEEADILIEPLGLDRNKNRIWSLDSSGRLYKSGNPFKRPCPLYTITSTRTELQVQLNKYTSYGNQSIDRPQGSGPKAKLTQAEAAAHRKLVKGVEEERKLAEKIDMLLPAIEKEDGRVQRARRKIQQAAEMAERTELRSTRTRRPTRKVDYTYDSDDIEDEPRKRGRKTHETYSPGPGPSILRLTIPGERKSTRVSARRME
ncbi:hypothetical protein TREMEDRAFT_14561, partial [Tremella mesenterica DSM 1558]|uniref:uncharacterized protein n=1 Tax=Tremella mesenterica (strain ATCC 24925 / CBS 8224 / DSM 1558 / NBRC 9311 / NRRL Y-6157 / RJB 2259-6 / UBC 559-6) TaxID=578456 RepID=UPI0003F49C21